MTVVLGAIFVVLHFDHLDHNLKKFFFYFYFFFCDVGGSDFQIASYVQMNIEYHCLPTTSGCIHALKAIIIFMLVSVLVCYNVEYPTLTYYMCILQNVYILKSWQQILHIQLVDN